MIDTDGMSAWGVARQHGLRARASVRRLPANHLVQHAAQAVNVAPGICVDLARGLLRAHVVWSSHRHPGLRQSIACRFGNCARDPEVAHHGVARHEQDVPGLDVPVHDVETVRVAERVRHLARDLNGILDRELALTRQPLAQGFLLDVGHDVVEKTVCFAGVDEAQDVGVVESGQDSDLAQEALRTHALRQIRMQDFQRDLAGVLHVEGEVDRSHPAAADLRLDLVPAGKGGLQPREQIGHSQWLRQRTMCAGMAS